MPCARSIPPDTAVIIEGGVAVGSAHDVGMLVDCGIAALRNGAAAAEVTAVVPTPLMLGSGGGSRAAEVAPGAPATVAAAEEGTPQPC